MDLRESRLIRRLKQRDETAFREMIKTYQSEVFNLVFRMLGNRAEAEDLAQEIFVTVFKSIDGFRSESKFSTWLYRIAINTCKNRYKYLSRRKYHATRSLEQTPERQALEPTAENSALPLQAQISQPDKMLEGLQLEQAIQQAIASLEQEQRTLVVLRDIQGLSYQEIATITQLPEGTVKSRLHRARMELKDRLKQHI
jgi:RNA polymerase sigma-70 factor (ECF subfamily)